MKEVAPGAHDLQVLPAGRPDAPLTEFEDGRLGNRGDDGGVGRDHDLRAPLRQVVQQRHQAEAGDERKRRVRLVHQVEAALVDPRPQDLEEPLPVAQLVEPLGPAPAVLLQVGVQRVHGVGAQEVGPRGPPAHSPLNRQHLPGTRLGLPHPGLRGQDGPALRVEAVRLGQHFHDSRLPRPVLAHENSETRPELKSRTQELCGGRDGRGPGTWGNAGGTIRRPERPDEPRVARPVA
jgi:hypothetical protein